MDHPCTRWTLTGLSWAALFALGGCAALGPPVLQTLRLETSDPCPTASCEASNARGRWRVTGTPADLTVTVSPSALKVVCRRPDGTEARSSAPARPPGEVTAATVAGAAVGAGVVAGSVGSAALSYIPAAGAFALLGGAMIGAVGGQGLAAREHPLQYPSVIVVPLACQSAGSTP